MRRLACLAALLPVLTLALAGCGEKEDALEPTGSKHVELMLDYFPNADHAGIYAAQAAGHFEQAGLDVAIRQPPDPAAPIKQVAAGRVDLASYEPEVLARPGPRLKGELGAIVKRAAYLVISFAERKDFTGEKKNPKKNPPSPDPKINPPPLDRPGPDNSRPT